MTEQRANLQAINDMFQRTTPPNKEAQSLKSSWTNWYRGLRAYDIDSSKATYDEAVKRRTAFNKALVKGPDKSTPTPASKPMADAPILVPMSRPTLREGIHKSNPSTKQHVIDWQRVVGVTADGAFGPGTKAATMAWQRARGLSADGVVGAASWAKAQEESGAAVAKPQSIPQAAAQAAQAVNQVVQHVVSQSPAAQSSKRPTLREGIHKTDPSTKPHIVDWQNIIGVKADGAFGPGTKAATVSWQRSRGLTPDGIVGPATWNASQSPLPNAAAQAVQQVTQAVEAATKPSQTSSTQSTAAPKPAPTVASVIEAAKQAIPAATVTQAVDKIKTVNQATPIWVRAVAATGAVLSGLIFVKWLGAPKKRAV